MRNVIGLRVLLLFPTLLGAQQDPNYDSSAYELCNGIQAEPPSFLFFFDPDCWNDELYDFRECDCGQGFQALSNGMCQRGHCSPGYSATEYGECVRCPDKSARWCPALNKCICQKNFQLDKNNRCVACSKNKISNGYDECGCPPYYSYTSSDVTCEECDENEDRNPFTKRCECRTDFARNQTGYCILCTFEHMEVQFTSDLDEICVCSEGFRMNAEGDCVARPRRYGFKFVSIGFAIFCTLGLICGYAVRLYMNDGCQRCTSV